MATVREQLTQARDLIQEQRHDEARLLLVNIDHPKAHEWLEQLDTRFPAVKKQATRNRGATLPPPADPFASVAERTPERTAAPAKPKSADAGNAGITLVTVLLSGFVAVSVTIGLMLVADRSLDLHPYILNETRRVFTAPVALASFSTLIMGIIARLFGNTHNVLIGFYYVLLDIILLAGWHYSSYHMHWGDGLESMLSAEGISAYNAFLGSIPGPMMISYGAAILLSFTVAFPFGAATGEELRRRFLERD